MTTIVPAVGLADQIKEVGREIGMRRGVYPKWVAANRLSQEEVDQRIAAMEAVYATLKSLQQEDSGHG